MKCLAHHYLDYLVGLFYYRYPNNLVLFLFVLAETAFDCTVDGIIE